MSVCLGQLGAVTGRLCRGSGGGDGGGRSNGSREGGGREIELVVYSKV